MVYLIYYKMLKSHFNQCSSIHEYCVTVVFYYTITSECFIIGRLCLFSGTKYLKIVNEQFYGFSMGMEAILDMLKTILVWWNHLNALK